MTDAPPQPETITRLFDTVYPSFAMLAGLELELFTPLKDGPLSAEEIADATGALEWLRRWAGVYRTGIPRLVGRSRLGGF